MIFMIIHFILKINIIILAKIMGSSKVSVRYQVTISEDVRNYLKLKPQQTIGFIEDNGKIQIVTEF